MCRLPLVFPNFFYGELNIAPKVAERKDFIGANYICERHEVLTIIFFFFFFLYQINLVPKPLYIKDLLISLPPGLYEGKRPGNEVDIWRFCVLFS